MFLLLVSLLSLVATLAVTVLVAQGAARIGRIDYIPPAEGGHLPSVSVILSALNEAHTIEPALRSLLALDYPRLEVIVMNDRSSDDTGIVLDRMAAAYPALKVVHINHLPEGWLGKNHALHRGSILSAGDYLLFTDADVMFDKSIIRRAVRYSQEHGLDHLAVVPETPVTDHLLGMLLLYFGIGFFLRYTPWKVATSAESYVGQGAFNLVRRDAYLNAGGHQAIPMAVIDDMMLGHLIKRRGGRQDVLLSNHLLSVEWYQTTADMFRGLRKNVYAAFDFSLFPLLGATAFLAIADIWPWFALAFTTGAAFWINVASIAVKFAFFWRALTETRWSRRCLLYMPLGAPLTLALWWQACLITIFNKAIFWRGTSYPLGELRQHHHRYTHADAAPAAGKRQADN